MKTVLKPPMSTPISMVVVQESMLTSPFLKRSTYRVRTMLSTCAECSTAAKYPYSIRA